MLAGVSRAGYYRHWAGSEPRAEETAVRDAVQRVAIANRRYGYRSAAAARRFACQPQTRVAADAPG